MVVVYNSANFISIKLIIGGAWGGVMPIFTKTAVHFTLKFKNDNHLKYPVFRKQEWLMNATHCVYV